MLESLSSLARLILCLVILEVSTRSMAVPSPPTGSAELVPEYGYRYYTAEVGRWLARDPIGLSGGRNLCAMVRNAPINRIDHLGLWNPGIMKTGVTLAESEVILGGGPEDPVTDLSALATVLVAAVIAWIAPDPLPPPREEDDSWFYFVSATYRSATGQNSAKPTTPCQKCMLVHYSGGGTRQVFRYKYVRPFRPR